MDYFVKAPLKTLRQKNQPKGDSNPGQKAVGKSLNPRLHSPTSASDLRELS
jgi:hypothetical protein